MRKVLVMITAIGMALLAACGAPDSGGSVGGSTSAPGAGGAVETLFVGPQLRECEGVGPMQCMEVAPTAEGPWTLFYSEIEGFSYEPGFTYELRVRKETVANPPADGSSLRHILVEQVGKVAAGEAAGGASAELEGTSWLLSGIDAGEGPQAPAAGRGEAKFSFAQGRLAGSAGCNRLSASYSQSGETISVGPIVGTKMACPEPLMQQENAVSAILMGAERALVAGDTLTISAADGRSLVFSRA
jgi:heat shock protein HslJ